MMLKQVCYHDKAANHQLPIAVAVFVLLHLSANEEHWGSTPCLAWKGILVMDNTFPIKKHS